jgi:hypothetical protein
MKPLVALTGAEAVATWIGLLSAVVSIVLSVVAILFARDVDRRSMEISNQTIRSLESIQATVQRLSDDTGGLIKVAWERMLGSMATPAARADGDLQGLLKGLLGEFRQDVSELAPGEGVDKLTRDVAERLRRATTQGFDGGREGRPKGWAFNAGVEAIDSLPPLAIELLRYLERGQHLTRDQYRQLRRDPEMAAALDELRDRDLLLPFQSRDAPGDTVYGLAPWFRAVAGPALVFTGHETPSVPESQELRSALRQVGALPATSIDGSLPAPSAHVTS